MANRTLAEVFARLAILEGLNDAVGTDFLHEALRHAKRIHVKIIKGTGEKD